MIVENPRFTHGGNLVDCGECPWEDPQEHDPKLCQGHKCPTKETYPEAARKAMLEVCQ